MKEKIFKEVKAILTDIFDEENLDITENTSSNDIEEWDSLAQMNIMVALSRHFGIKFTVEEIASLQCVGDIVTTIEKRV